MKVHSIPGKLDVSYDTSAKAIIDKWSNYDVSLDEFKNAVLIKGLNWAKRNKARAWIVDSTSADGVFSTEIQKFIETDVFPAFAQNGIKFFVTIKSTSSAMTNLTISTYKAKVGPAGLKLVEAQSTINAIDWIKQNN